MLKSNNFIAVMNSVGRDDLFFDYLRANSKSILDSQLLKISIYEAKDKLIIDLYFKLITNEQVLIKFIDLTEYGFCHNAKFSFYTVERYKLFKTEDNNYYVSLDPYTELEELDELDQDFIYSKHIEGFIGD